jgi:hypothetical protein
MKQRQALNMNFFNDQIRRKKTLPPRASNIFHPRMSVFHQEDDHVLLSETFKEQHKWRNVLTHIP